MIVYVETNFLLEVALVQEQYESCQQLLALLEAGAIKLTVPAFCFGESYETLTRRAKERNELVRQIRQQVGQMRRSPPQQATTAEWESVAGQLLTGTRDDWNRLRQIHEQLLRTADVIAQDAYVIGTAMQYEQQYELTPQDALVYASVMQHLQAAPATPKVFLSRNFKDFDDPDIVGALGDYGCKMLFRFSDGVRYASSHLR